MSVPTWLRRTGKIAAWVLLGVVLLVCALGVFIQTPPGEAAFGSALEAVVSSQTRGRLVIGHIEDIGWDGSVHARNVRIIGPMGGKVLGAERLSVQASVSELLVGRIVFTKARWDGGGFQIDQVPAGNTEIERAFKSPGKKKKPGGKSPLADRLDLRGIHFENLVGIFDIAGAPTIRLENVQGMARVWLDEQGKARLRIDEGKAHWAKPSPLGMTGTLREIRGRVHGGAKKVADFRLMAELGDGAFDVRLRYFDREKPPKVKLDMEGDGLSATLLGALGLNVVSEFVAPLQMSVALTGAGDGFEHKIRDAEGNPVKTRSRGEKDSGKQAKNEAGED